MEIISAEWKSFPQNGNHFRKMEIISAKEEICFEKCIIVFLAS
jgi:hypothetical protein